MVTIAVAAQKGGVGKTTTAHAAGHGLRYGGHRVLFVDLDAQGNLSQTMGVDETGATIYDVMKRRVSAADAIQHTASGDIIPYDPNLSMADTELKDVGREYTLREALESVSTRYDYVILDTPPALGILTVNALTASNVVIVPSQADIYCLRSIEKLNETIGVVRKYTNPGLKVAGILLTRHSGRSVLSRDMAEMLAVVAESIGTKVFRTVIREGVAIREAQAMRTDIYTYAPRSNAAADYTEFVDELMEGV